MNRKTQFDNTQQNPNFLIRNCFLKSKDLFSSKGKNIKLLPGQFLSPAESEGYSNFYVLEGILAFSMEDALGDERIICFFGENTFISTQDNYGKLFSGYSKDIIKLAAFTPCTLLDISAEDMEEIHSCALFEEEQNEMTAKLLKLLLYKSVRLPSGNSLDTVCNFLWNYIYELYPNGVRLTQNQMAQVIGTTRLQVARAFRSLREEGYIISQKGKISLTDEKKFFELCDQKVLEMWT